MKKTIIIVAVLAAALAGFYWLTHYRAAQKAALESAPQEATVIKVRVISPTEEIIHEKVSFVGNVEAEETVPVYPKLKDLTITAINVNVGDRVKEGDVLARLDNSLMSTNLQQARQGVATAEANVRQAESTFQTQKRDYDRYKSLVADGVVSKQEFDRIENQYRIAEEQRRTAQFALADAKAALSNVQINMGYHSVVAPASGIISERNADPGDKSNPDAAMFVVSRQDRLKLTGSVPENAFMKLALGAPATVVAEALPGETFKASVTRIYPTIDV
ncbi:efflux RND transporter periplasmic adaptor subunit, partial [Synergistaceae bacterium OttesenSCG-928-I11]|nr:efflux RND transporter periplasmic adaptor subunit [Synergistaceae bacterium OttesenSCG-928-I11]